MINLIKKSRTMREQIEIAEKEGLTVIGIRPGGRHAKLTTQLPGGEEVIFPLMVRCTDWRMRENFRRMVRTSKGPYGVNPMLDKEKRHRWTMIGDYVKWRDQLKAVDAAVKEEQRTARQRLEDQNLVILGRLQALKRGQRQDAARHRLPVDQEVGYGRRRRCFLEICRRASRRQVMGLDRRAGECARSFDVHQGPQSPTAGGKLHRDGSRRCAAGRRRN